MSNAYYPMKLIDFCMKYNNIKLMTIDLKINCSCRNYNKYRSISHYTWYYKIDNHRFEDKL